MRRLLIRMSFAAVGEGGGHRTRFIRLWRPTFCQSELHPHFQRSIKDPDLGRGLVLVARNALRPSRHDSPNDPLAGHSDYVAFEGPQHHFHSPSERLRNCGSTCGASGRTRTCVHFVRSEGHQSSLARTLKSLVGELRIELSPRAPKARMQRITPFPDGASPAS
jgi:hypothetical protein